MSSTKIDKSYEEVKEYYGTKLTSTADLKTSACCDLSAFPEHIKPILASIDDEIHSRFYGCGSPLPLVMEGLKVLDLGCGVGRDAFVMSKLVGPDGKVWGLDMTEEQLQVAQKHREKQAQAFGFDEANTEFILDYMENIDQHFEDESLDLVTSNCVINLTEDKELVLKKAYEALKFGGELYFADIYADRRIPEELASDPVLRGECLGGALYEEDFRRICQKVGFLDQRMVETRELTIDDPEIAARLGHITFYSRTYRLFKLKRIEDACEDYGHVARYKGTIGQSPLAYTLDQSHVFPRNRPVVVCGNTALMLSQTRLADHFEVEGNFKEHFGFFEECTSPYTAPSHQPQIQDQSSSTTGGCC